MERADLMARSTVGRRVVYRESDLIAWIEAAFAKNEQVVGGPEVTRHLDGTPHLVSSLLVK